VSFSHLNTKIVVCIPAYNEAASIRDVISKAKRYANEIIVYDDGSTDNTYEIAKTSGATAVIRAQYNRGYGAAIRALFQASRDKNADIMITLDSDGQHDADQIPDIIEPIVKQECDMVIGSRFLTNRDSQRVPRYRSMGIKTITRFTQYASYEGITDAQSGFRAYNRNALSKINLFEEGMSVSTEILLRAKEKNLIVKEVPVTISYDIKNKNRGFTKNPISHGIGVLYGVIQFVSLRHPMAFYGLPGVILLIIAAIFINNALDLFSRTRFVSTNMILISVGASVVGVVLLATGAILYTMIALLKGKIREDV
jgi:glycosyltransferase involved in cell wall biosynthesis